MCWIVIRQGQPFLMCFFLPESVDRNMDVRTIDTTYYATKHIIQSTIQPLVHVCIHRQGPLRQDKGYSPVIGEAPPREAPRRCDWGPHNCML